jgi:hypothetical protein
MLLGSVAFAGGVGSETQATVRTDGVPGWTSQTSGSATCQIDPWCYAPGESNVRFEAMPHSENFTSIYLVQKNQRKPSVKFSTISFPYGSHAIQWNGIVEVGSMEARQTVKVKFSDDNFPVRHAWTLCVYAPNGVQMQETTTTDPNGYYTEKFYELPAIPGARYPFTVTAVPLQ